MLPTGSKTNDRGNRFVAYRTLDTLHGCALVSPDQRRIEVFRPDGGEDWLCIHSDVQGSRDAAFAERMFAYNYRIYDRHRRAVARLAGLADDDPA